MNEKEIKVNEAEEIKVDMTINEPEETETKKAKAWNLTKKIGMAIWEGIKITCAGVGAFVLSALFVGIAIGKKEDNDSSEYTGGELNADDNSTANETSEETSNEEFDL